jgi:hypothetical protein
MELAGGLSVWSGIEKGDKMEIFVGVLLATVGFLLVGIILLLMRRPGEPRITVHSGIEHMKSIGQLSVFKVVTKEIVTEIDHTWGEFGEKYLSWIVSGKKMAIIFEFEIDFRYDLRRPEFEIVPGADNSYTIKMPPCFFDAHIRDIRFYDEQRSRFMPWLLPELLNGFLSGGFSESDKNKLVSAAKSHAAKQAVELIGSIQSEVENSAKTTLESISKALGAKQTTFEFPRQGDVDLEIKMAGKLVA